MSDIAIAPILLVLAIVLIIYLIAQNSTRTKDSAVEPYRPDIDHDYDNYQTYQTYRDLYPIGPNIRSDWAYLSSRGLLPWWNSTRYTRNSSYDIRGDIPPILYDVGPWNVSPIMDRFYQRY